MLARHMWHAWLQVWRAALARCAACNQGPRPGVRADARPRRARLSRRWWTRPTGCCARATRTGCRTSWRPPRACRPPPACPRPRPPRAAVRSPCLRLCSLPGCALHYLHILGVIRPRAAGFSSLAVIGAGGPMRMLFLNLGNQNPRLQCVQAPVRHGLRFLTCCRPCGLLPTGQPLQAMPRLCVAPFC